MKIFAWIPTLKKVISIMHSEKVKEKRKKSSLHNIDMKEILFLNSLLTQNGKLHKKRLSLENFKVFYSQRKKEKSQQR